MITKRTLSFIKRSPTVENLLNESVREQEKVEATRRVIDIGKGCRSAVTFPSLVTHYDYYRKGDDFNQVIPALNRVFVSQVNNINVLELIIDIFCTPGVDMRKDLGNG